MENFEAFLSPGMNSTPRFARLRGPLRRFVERQLPEKGKIFVEKDNRVLPYDVLGEAQFSRGAYTLPLGRLFGVAPALLPSVLRVQKGDEVYPGGVLAQKGRLPFGLWQKRFLSPWAGRVETIDSHRGELVLRSPIETFRLLSGVAGRVADIIPGKSVLIEAEVVEVRAALGVGKDGEGEFTVVAAPTETLMPDKIDHRLAGHILFGGAFCTLEALEKALALGVRGIITGGVTHRDARSFFKMSPFAKTTAFGHEFGLLLLSGFGKVPVSFSLFDFLKKIEARHVFLFPSHSLLLIPLPNDSVADRPGIEEDIFVSLSVADRVLVFAWPYWGFTGTVSEVRPNEAVVKLEAKDEKLNVPLTRLVKVEENANV